MTNITIISSQGLKSQWKQSLSFTVPIQTGSKQKPVHGMGEVPSGDSLLPGDKLLPTKYRLGRLQRRSAEEEEIDGVPAM